jgi:hypothetical protein
MTALPTYDADQLAGLLEILPDVDAVELKLSVPDTDHRPVLRSLGIDSLDAEIRQVAFVETPDLRLFGAGLVVRARRTQRKPADTTVKLRPMLPADVPAKLRELSDLVVLGPLSLLKVKFAPAGYARRMVAELWFLPDGSRILELSTKCTPVEAFQVAAETKVFLAGHGLDLGAPQETKTRSALAALAAVLEKE